MSIALHRGHVPGCEPQAAGLRNLGYAVVHDTDLHNLETRLAFLEKFHTEHERAQQDSAPVAQNNIPDADTAAHTHTSEDLNHYGTLKIRTVTTTQLFITESDA